MLMTRWLGGAWGAILVGVAGGGMRATGWSHILRQCGGRLQYWCGAGEAECGAEEAVGFFNRHGRQPSTVPTN
jgi:hypothetical protein